MQSLNIDLTSYSATKSTFIDLFGIHDQEYLISDFLLGRERKDATVEALQ